MENIVFNFLKNLFKTKTTAEDLELAAAVAEKNLKDANEIINAPVKKRTTRKKAQ